MSEKRPASEKTVQAFIHAVYPESTELCMAMNGEGDVLREATRLILDRRAPDPEKQELVDALKAELAWICGLRNHKIEEQENAKLPSLYELRNRYEVLEALLHRHEEKKP